MPHDAIVIGLGVMGLATAAELARRGARVLGIEQFGIPHARGSSHGVARVFRTAYFEHADYVPLLKRAHEAWRALGEEAGGPLLLETGVLYGGPADSALITGSLASARQHDLAVETLPGDELTRRFPQFTLEEGMVALFEPAAGMLLAEASLNAFAGIALRHGAELRAFEPVNSWTAEGDGVRVRTVRGEYSAAKLIFCGGPWSGRLLAELGLPLRVTRQVSAWIWPREPEAFALDRFPTWAIESAHGAFYYGFPLHPSATGMKVAGHDPGPEFDPDSPHRPVDPADADGALAFLSQHIPAAAGQVVNLQACLYTMTPDSHFIIDRHPAHANVHLAAGFSGHGFKFAPVIGEAMADLALEGATRHPVGFLSLSRLIGQGRAATRP
jgi:sarcosine oxidase